MDFRPGCVKCHDLKEQCYDLVTQDRHAYWEPTKLRMELRKISWNGLLRLALAITKTRA